MFQAIQPITNSLIEEKQVVYVDISTRNINTGTGVVGSNSNFTLQNMNLDLNPAKKYRVNVQSFIYENLVVGANVFPLLLSDIPPGELLRSVAEPDIFKIALSLGSFDFTRSLTALRYVANNSFPKVRQGWCKQ